MSHDDCPLFDDNYALHLLVSISQEALLSFEQAIAIKPDYYDAWLNRGIVLNLKKKYEEALLSYDRAIQIEFDSYIAWLQKGAILFRQKKYKEALLSFERAIEIEPNLHIGWFNRGVILNDQKKYEEALLSYDRAIQIAPQFLAAVMNKGVTLDSLNKYTESLSSYNKLIKIKPDYCMAWNNRGIALQKLGKCEEALLSLDKAIQIDPERYEVWLAHGILLSHQHQFEEALLSLDKAISIKCDSHEAWCARGLVTNAKHPTSYNCFPKTILKNSNLNKRGYEGELASYKEGLKNCLQDTHPEGWGRLHLAIGNAHYFKGKSERYPRSYWQKALKSYHQALETLTIKYFPEEHLKVLKALIQTYLAFGEIEQAEELQRRGTDVYKLLLNKCPSPGRKKQLSLKFASFQQLTVDISVKLGKLIKGFELAEFGKNACLIWILYGYSEEISAPTWKEIQQQLLTPQTAIIYWHISPASLHIFILKHDAESPILITTSVSSTEEQHPEPLERLNQFENWVKNWNHQYNEYGVQPTYVQNRTRCKVM